MPSDVSCLRAQADLLLIPLIGCDTPPVHPFSFGQHLLVCIPDVEKQHMRVIIHTTCSHPGGVSSEPMQGASKAKQSKAKHSDSKQPKPWREERGFFSPQAKWEACSYTG